MFGAAVSLTGANSNEGRLTKDGYNFWKKTVNDAGGLIVGGQRYMVDVKILRRRIQPGHERETDRETDHRGQDQLHPRPVRHEPDPLRQRDHREVQEADGRGERRGGGDLHPRLQVRLFPDHARASSTCAASSTPASTRTRPIKTIAILADNDAFSVEVADGTQAYAKEKGLNVLYYEKVPQDTKDVSAQLTQIKPKNPDLFICSGHYNSAALVMKQAKELKFNPKAFGFSVGPALPQFTDSLKDAAEYVFGGTQWTPSLKFNDEQFGTAADYATKFKAFAGYDPAYQNAESTCAGQCFQQALAKAGSLDTEKVRDALAALQFKSFFADVKFDSRGINVDKPMAAEQIQDGKKVTVWPKEAASGAIKYPTPAWDKR